MKADSIEQSVTPPPTALSMGLKEWAIVCLALEQGQQAVLLRKGGIYEAAGEFELEHREFVLLPTYLHQKAASVKPSWRSHISTVATEPDQILVKSWARMEHIFPVPSRTALEALDDLYLWDKPLLDMRFAYRPNSPLYLILLQTFLLATPTTIVNHPAYAGCKSWVPLLAKLDLRGSVPVLPPAKIKQLSERIQMAFAA
ncbi:MAG: DUF1802 family protein [Phycisphaerae bacterium]|nr:DUF1802 family protein [Phycisphaerae bacterium]